MREIMEEEPNCEAEDCDACGCHAGEFDSSTDFYDGTWHCPDCGAVQ